MTNPDATVAQLVDAGVKILRAYLVDHRTDHLKQLAELIIPLRSAHAYKDGRTDWSGRTPGYKDAIADLYTRAGVPADKKKALEAALRYHIGNLLREQAPAQELEAVKLSPIAPKTRLATARKAIQAQQKQSAPRQDVVSLADKARALVEHIDEKAIPDLSREGRVESRLALEAVRGRVVQLLARLVDEAGD